MANWKVHVPPVNRKDDKYHTSTVVRRITTFRSTTECKYDGGPIILYYNTYHCVVGPVAQSV